MMLLHATAAITTHAPHVRITTTILTLMDTGVRE
jgi:hypothetical protein